jgi:hypothetical protein
MAPYVPLLMPELQKALLDPLPEVRATSARAMGSLLRGMGPASLGDLLPWLLTTLRSEGSSVERSGAAQVCVCVCLCCLGVGGRREQGLLLLQARDVGATHCTTAKHACRPRTAARTHPLATTGPG